MPYLPQITIEKDGLYCRAVKELRDPIAEILQYEKKIRKPSQFGVKIVRKPAYFIDRRSGRFLSGLLERVTKHLAAKKIPCVLNINAYSDSPPGPIVDPILHGITLRPDQEKLALLARRFVRGVIVSPTGSGKTITALGIISMWPQARSLILVHRRDIVNQFAERAREFLPHIKTQIIVPGARQPLTGQLVCSTIQSIVKYPINEIIDTFDITICDECHHVSDRAGMFGKFMGQNLSPVKIGFTATTSPERHKLLTMEGILGPIIGQLTLKEGQAMGIIAQPYVTLVTVPYDVTIGERRKYRELYTFGIVNNRARNARITKLALDRARKKCTSITIITDIAQGDNLKHMAEHLGLNSLFVQGHTKSQEREKIKRVLIEKEVDNVICTNVWKEGIDIPSVNSIIIAGGGKSALQVVQSVGRGMRTDKGKDTVEIIDFLDPYRYLAEHAIMRISVYVEKGWMN